MELLKLLCNLNASGARWSQLKKLSKWTGFWCLSGCGKRTAIRRIFGIHGKSADEGPWLSALLPFHWRLCVTLNRHVALNSVLRQYVCSSEAWLSMKLGYSFVVKWMPLANFRLKRTAAALQHRPASLRQRDFFLVLQWGGYGKGMPLAALQYRITNVLHYEITLIQWYLQRRVRTVFCMFGVNVFATFVFILV